MQQNWYKGFLYTFQLFYLIGHKLQKLQLKSIKKYVSDNPSLSYSTILSLIVNNVDKKSSTPAQRKKLIQRPFRQRAFIIRGKHPETSSNDLCQEFHRQLPNLSQGLGEGHLYQVTNWTGESGLAGVLGS